MNDLLVMLTILGCIGTGFFLGWKLARSRSRERELTWYTTCQRLTNERNWLHKQLNINATNGVRFDAEGGFSIIQEEVIDDRDQAQIID